jgi:nitrate reductase delta subunit
MQNERTLLEGVASLLTYPGEDYHRMAEMCLARAVAEARPDDPEARTETGTLSDCVGALSGLNLDEVEELFTRTFDLNPTCALDIGWHLYGEQYDRGDFLVSMRNALKEQGIEEVTELPDHLPNVLRLLARMPDEQAADLARSAVLPALGKMLTAFPDEGNPYRSLLVYLQTTLNRFFAVQAEGVVHD